MSPSRRDLIKFATAGALLASLPAADAATAMRALEAPQSPVRELDPASFAEHTFINMFDDGSVWAASVAPVEWSAVQHSFDRLRELIPDLNATPGTPLWKAYCEFESDFLHLINTSHWIGLRHGAALENLRRNLLQDQTECRSCWGSGALNNRTCAKCDGNGYVKFVAEAARLQNAEGTR